MLAQNKKVYFDYEILETYEAGIELLGHEVKSVKAGHARLDGARVIVRGAEAFLVGAFVPPYQAGNVGADYDPERTRKLLLNKNEIAYLVGRQQAEGLTLVPIKLYNKGRKVKLEFGVARGKKKHDKRETIKKRETDRNIRRSLKNY